MSRRCDRPGPCTPREYAAREMFRTRNFRVRQGQPPRPTGLINEIRGRVARYAARARHQCTYASYVRSPARGTWFVRLQKRDRAPVVEAQPAASVAAKGGGPQQLLPGATCLLPVRFDDHEQLSRKAASPTSSRARSSRTDRRSPSEPAREAALPTGHVPRDRSSVVAEGRRPRDERQADCVHVGGILAQAR